MRSRRRRAARRPRERGTVAPQHRFIKIKISDASELDSMMGDDAYAEHIKE